MSDREKKRVCNFTISYRISSIEKDIRKGSEEKSSQVNVTEPKRQQKVQKKV
jgi:hypothetical protein